MSKHSSRGTAWKRTQKRILERDNHTCGYCGRDATTVDHVIAKLNGGTDDDSNLIACCLQCNATKGARTLVRTAYYDPDWLTHV